METCQKICTWWRSFSYWESDVEIPTLSLYGVNATSPQMCPLHYMMCDLIPCVVCVTGDLKNWLWVAYHFFSILLVFEYTASSLESLMWKVCGFILHWAKQLLWTFFLDPLLLLLCDGHESKPYRSLCAPWRTKPKDFTAIFQVCGECLMLKR